MRLNIDVLVTEGTPASLAAKQATRLVPVIMVYVGDRVASGLVGSLGRPGGHLTGVSLNANEIVRKDAELLNRLPIVTNTAAYIKEGLLAGHGPNLPDRYHRAAIYIDRVLKGAQPAESPVEQPTTLDLVINGRTAKVLALALPQSILLRAAEVVE